MAARPGVPTDRRALQSVALQFAVNGWTYAAFIPRLPEIRDRNDVSVRTIGIALTVASLAALLGSLRTGSVVSRFGTKRVLTLSAAISISSLVLIGVSRHPAVLITGLVLFAFFDIFADVAMNVQGSTLSARRHTPVMNRLHGLWSLGTVAGGTVTALVAGAGVSVPMHLVVTAGVLLVVLWFVSVGLLPTDEARAAPPPGPVGAAGAAGAAGRARRRLGPATVVLGCGSFVAIAVEVSGADWSTFRLSGDLGAVQRTAVFAFVGFTLGMTLGRMAGDSVQVRLGRKRMTQLSGALQLGGLVLATLVASPPVSIAGFLLIGLGNSVLFPQIYDAAAQAPGPPGSGFTAMLVGQRAGAMAAPLIIGTLADRGGIGFGQAIAIVGFPCAVLVLVGAGRLARLAREPAGAP